MGLDRHESFKKVRFLAAASLCGLLLTSCFLGMDSFEDWEVAVGDYLSALPTEVKDQFPDEAHVVAYALSVDCFAEAEPRSDLDRSVKSACELSLIHI